MSAAHPSRLDYGRGAKQHSCNGAAVDGCLAHCVALRESLKNADDLLRHFGQSTPRFFERTSLPRRTIFRRGEPVGGIPIICSGWAATIAGPGDSHRQITSFLLPGDLVSGALIFEDKLDVTVEAVNAVTYHNYNRAEFRAALASGPNLFKSILKLWTEENLQIGQLVVDFGQCSAAGRIARLIMRLLERLARRHMVKNGTFEFPLRRRHIAEYTALTPGHVSTVIGRLRDAGVIDLKDRSLTVRDLPALKRLSRT